MLDITAENPRAIERCSIAVFNSTAEELNDFQIVLNSTVFLSVVEMNDF
jgi:hypothetical protein